MAIRDSYANIASFNVTSGADGAIDFAELQTGISLGQGMGLVIDQINYYFQGFNPQTEADYGEIALCTSNNISDIADPNQKQVVDFCKKQVFDHGTPATSIISKQPDIHQFLPPLIVAAPRLYIGARSDCALVAKMRMFYRYIKLTSQEYLEIAESFILVG